jgi:hypothetical protein
MVFPSLPHLTFRNMNGGTYVQGRMYSIEKKAEVKDAYIELIQELYPLKPTYHVIARRAKVGYNYARKVVREVNAHNGSIVDPYLLREQHRLSIGPIQPGKKTLSVADEIFLLSLRSDNPARPLSSYVNELYHSRGLQISESTISRWLLYRFDFRGSFRKPNLVPLDKYRLENIARYKEFMDKKFMITDHRRFIFLDEKHIVNKDTVPNMVRACPITGRVSAIQVSGDFREAYSIIAVISANPTKVKPVAYTIGQKNGDANSFLFFIELLISSRYLQHNEILIMDNAAIHTGGAAGIVESLLWNFILDGRPLRVLVVYLPTRSPELNPIELVFHILARRSRDWRLYGNFDGRSIVRNASQVMNEMSYDLIRRCCVHCGYNL